MAISVNQVVGLLIGILLLGIMLPIGLTDILEFSSTNSTIETLVTIVLPLVGVIGFVLVLLPKTGGND